VNQIIGFIPSELGNLKALEILRMADNFLEGTIPSEIGSLPNLVDLYLEYNSLSGKIPSEFGLFTVLGTSWSLFFSETYDLATYRR
jgi:hypothetical protein